jgi:hypothetical protein
MSTSPFTPRVIVKDSRLRLLAGFLLCTIIGVSTHHLTTPASLNANPHQTWNTFSGGSHTNTTPDPTTGALSLALEGQSVTDTTQADFFWWLQRSDSGWNDRRH